MPELINTVDIHTCDILDKLEYVKTVVSAFKKTGAKPFFNDSSTLYGEHRRNQRIDMAECTIVH